MQRTGALILYQVWVLNLMLNSLITLTRSDGRSGLDLMVEVASATRSFDSLPATRARRRLFVVVQFGAGFERILIFYLLLQLGLRCLLSLDWVKSVAVLGVHYFFYRVSSFLS